MRDLVTPQPYPAISEYLTLQALLIQWGDAPVDPDSYSWLEGLLKTSIGASAPCGHWSRDFGQVRLIWLVSGDHFSNVGVRPPVG